MNNNQNTSQRLQSLIIAEIEAGLPLVPEPYAEIANRLGVTEAEVTETLKALKEDGCIKRFGVIVRHRELGYLANAMVVWDVPDELVDEIGQLFGHASFVTLCYRRPRRLPNWPYNLFTMIHGANRDHVLHQVDSLRELAPDTNFPSAILFSGRRFKQRGARYSNSHIDGESSRPKRFTDNKSGSIA
ncbi:MAG: siroheme decarboxylase subunit beta [bacterium]